MQQVKFFCKKKVNSRWTGVFSSAMRKKIFASKKIWFGNSRTNVFLGQNILFRLRIICTCCLYKHACRKLDWSTSFKIHIRCPGIWQNSSLIFDFFFFWKFKFYPILLGWNFENVFKNWQNQDRNFVGTWK